MTEDIKEAVRDLIRKEVKLEVTSKLEPVSGHCRAINLGPYRNVYYVRLMLNDETLSQIEIDPD